MSAARKVSYAFLAALAAAVLALNLGNALLAGLFSYMILDLSGRKLGEVVPRWASRWAAVAVFLVTAVCLALMFVSFLRMAVVRASLILASLLPRIDSLASQYGVDIPFENLPELRGVIIDALRENARSVTHASGLLTKGFFQILASIFTAILCFMGEPPAAHRQTLLDSVRREFNERIAVFMGGFEKIIGAQVLVSFINTGVTAIFLLVIGIPYVHFLTLSTFILGVVPVVGNVVSNAIIVGTALTVSPHLAALSLVFLVVVHHLQYVLYGQIIGAGINTPLWQILLGLMIGEALLGVPGMILAPAVLHCLREELRAAPLKSL